VYVALGMVVESIVGLRGEFKNDLGVSWFIHDYPVEIVCDEGRDENGIPKVVPYRNCFSDRGYIVAVWQEKGSYSGKENLEVVLEEKLKQLANVQKTALREVGDEDYQVINPPGKEIKIYETLINAGMDIGKITAGTLLKVALIAKPQDD